MFAGLTARWSCRLERKGRQLVPNSKHWFTTSVLAGKRCSVCELLIGEEGECLQD